jgi:hypothetical protein
MIVLRTPKGWTCPKEADGIPIEGTFRAHQVPLATVRENPEHLKILEAWMRSYKPEEFFDQKGRFSEGDYVAPDVWRRKTIDGMGRNHWPDGPVCRDDLHNPAVVGYCVVPAATKWTALGEPAACGHARIVGAIAGEIEAVRTKEWTATQRFPDKSNRTHHTFASGESATLSGGKTSGMSRRATPIRLSAIP